MMYECGVSPTPQVQAFMAERANSKKTVIVKGASHVVMVSHPEAVAKLIESAAAATVTTVGADAR